MKPRSIAMNVDSGEKTWLTPPDIIERLGPFDLDPCCPANMPWRTATRMVSLPEDGLSVDWSGKRVWCNPPYGREAVPFLRKMAKNANGGGVFSHIRKNGHLGVAGLGFSVRLRGVVCARTDQVLQGGRRSGRDRSGSIRPYRVHARGFQASVRFGDQGVCRKVCR